ncbi:SLAP domain-containing protein [Companilactobacillus sp. HBUAS59544]|uniref:SLAP domain-containing protein n=1 Tax=Companilactobacillus sp. HBUAS59544 TaxID=3109363 RepID=UPI002FEFF5E3
MKKNKALIGSALALLIAPAVLSNLSPQDVDAAVATPSNLVGTVRRGSGVLVNSQGQTITSTYLPNFSSWKLGATTQINGITYYQVATDQWIAASSIVISDATPQVDTSVSGQNATTKWNAAVVNSQGQAISGVTLPANSNWKLGASLTINGKVYYQVATNEFVAASDLNIGQTQTTTQTQAATSTQDVQNTQDQSNQQLVGQVVNGPADLYDTSMDAFSSRQLAEGTNWKVGNMVQNKYGHTFYQVSTNEWAQSSNMKLNQDASSQVTSEPEFATSVTQ